MYLYLLSVAISIRTEEVNAIELCDLEMHLAPIGFKKEVYFFLNPWHVVKTPFRQVEFRKFP